MKHTLKTIQPYFSEVESGNKTFEVRKDDRNFQVGDVLFLQEYDKEKNSYSGKELEFVVIYILKDFPAIKKGYVVLGIREKE